MKLAEINALRFLTVDELAATAGLLGISLADLREKRPVLFVDGGPQVTKEMLRLAIIDAVCGAELSAAKMDEMQAMRDKAVEDHDEPCDCGHGIGSHAAIQTPGLYEPVAGRCLVEGCDCAAYAMDEAEALR